MGSSRPIRGAQLRRAPNKLGPCILKNSVVHQKRLKRSLIANHLVILLVRDEKFTNVKFLQKF